MQKLNTDNAEHLIYSNEFISIEVLGGVRLEGLDRMRVTLKVSLNESEIPPIRHNLDLYNDTQLEKFIRKIAERLEIGTSITAGTLAELTGQLENYRLEKIKQSNCQEQQAKPLTDKERKEAIEYLTAHDLLLTTQNDLQASGIQGEAENALILFIAMTSRKTNDPLSVVCLAKSGTGKSYLMERVAMCIPDEDKKEHTQFTSNAFYYYKREEIRHKAFLIEDLEGALGVLFPIRELQSKKRISKTVTQKGRDGKLQTITLIVEGPVCVVACTTKESIYEDNANRSILIYLNDSKEQDEKIMDYQKRLRAGLIDSSKERAIQHKLQWMQKALAPIRVINPYAPLIDLPENFPKKRRALPILLSFIEAITFYHQHQRVELVEKETGEIYIETQADDIEQGFRLLAKVLLRRSDELSGAVREFYERLKAVTEQGKLQRFRISDVRRQLNTPPRTIQHYISTLKEYDYIQVSGGRQRTGYEYELLNSTTETILQTAIESHIQTVMERIRKPQPKVQSNKHKQELAKEALPIE